jgi:glucose 1-dehydrogenase
MQLLLWFFAAAFYIPAVTTMAYSLAGKRVLVTGASGGIGKGLALQVAQHGAQVLVHYHTREQGAQDTKRQIEALGGTCAGIVQADFRNPADCHRLMQAIDEVWDDGRLDVLINNAGIVCKVALQDDADLTQWHECMAVNLHAPALLSQLAIPRMKRNKPSDDKRTRGVILNVSSIHGERSNEYMGAYAASKAALESATRTLALEHAADHIRINAIAPGVVPVERTAKAFSDPSLVKSWTDRIPVGRLGTVEQVAQAAMPLLTNDWMTGTVWQIDGGLMARNNMPVRERPPILPDGFA